jgi:hypothetical protein
MSDRRVWVPVAVVAAVGLVVGLVVGVLVGGRTDLVSQGAAKAGTSAPSVSVGAIQQYPLRASTGWDFELPVHNPTNAPLQADLLSFAGYVTPFKADTTSRLEPHAWGIIRFSATPSCDVAPPTSVSSVRLRISGTSSRSEVTRALPDSGRALVEHDAAMCGVGSPVHPGDLAGVWLVERAYGPDMYLAGSYLMRFTRGGSFEADADGRLFSGDPAVRSTYRIRDELLEITTRNSSGCGSGTLATWRASYDAAGRLVMVYVNGDCPEGDQGDVWVARRVLHDEGLPRGD